MPDTSTPNWLTRITLERRPKAQPGMTAEPKERLKFRRRVVGGWKGVAEGLRSSSSNERA
jgi:hypothetical protein